MIDPAATITFVRYLRENDFTSASEKLIAIIVVNLPEVQQCELIEMLELSDPHTRKTLRSSVEANIRLIV